MAMDGSWSHTPNPVWWALEASSSVNLQEGNSPPNPPTPHRARSPTLRPRPQMPGKEVTNFYDYADEGEEEVEGDLHEWVVQHASRGVIRVYQPGSSYSELVSCMQDTTADTIMARCLAKELNVQYGSGQQRSVRLDDHPLEIQNQFLRSLGYTDSQRIQLEGLSTDLGPLFKFVVGHEQGKKPEERVQLACALKVKEMNGLGVWSKRFCVLCGARLFIFPTSRPKGKPTLVLDLTGGKMMEHKSRKSYYCVKVAALRREVLLAFDTRLEQSKWLERAAKVVSKHPLEANLAGCSLEHIPKYFFLNYYLVAMNLSRNFMKENYNRTTLSLGGPGRVIGWINDLPYFHHLVSLSLSDNQLDQFPVSLCIIHTLQELDLSRNRIKVLPQEIQRLTSLTTLLLHSNHLTSLPQGLVDLKQLSTLVIAFNQFIEIPPLLKEVPALSTLIVSGNTISTVPDDIFLIEHLQHFDLRLNRLRSQLPLRMSELARLVRLNVRGTGMREIDTRNFPFVEDLNCADNRLRSLMLPEGPLRSVMAANNSIAQFTVAPTCIQLTSINISKNQLTSLPEPLAGLCSLEKLNISHNRLTVLPAGIFTMPELQLLQASNNHLKSLPASVAEGCGLQVLDLHGNQLTSLPQQLIMRAPNLHTLNVSSNQLSVLPLVSPHGSGPALSTLLAASNKLGDGVLPTISCCKNLKVLHLAYNRLQNTLASTFLQLKQLEYLNLSGNALHSLPSLPHCFHLHTLSLHSSHLTTFPKDTPPLRQLVTFDLAGNKLTQLPDMMYFSRLKYMDLSDNTDVRIRENDVDKIKPLSRCVLEGGLGIHSDARALLQVESGSVASHNRWSFGSAQTTGLSGNPDCTVQVKIPTLASGKDGLFAIMDGGRSADAPVIIQKVLPDLLTRELAAQKAEPTTRDTPTNPLQYLTHTFLAAHQMLGKTGQSYGCSMVLCHMHMLHSRKLVLNVANAGLGEAILCRSGRAVSLTTAHSPASCGEERVRVKEAGGFISQDYRVNGVCSTSRLIGCYHLGPEVIPTPSMESVVLRPGDEFVVIGSESLWRYVSHELAALTVRRIAHSGSSARKLRDLAVAHGCKTDVSVIVVQLNIPEGVEPDESLVHSDGKHKNFVPELESDENGVEDVAFTNIDDILSDSEDDVEQRHESTWNGVKLRKKKDVEPQTERTESDIDRMILSAISSPPTSPVSPEMKSTNIDEILSSSPAPPPVPFPPHNSHSPHMHTLSTTRTATGTQGEKGIGRGGRKGEGGRGGGRAPNHPAPPTGLNYPAQTIPRDAAGSRTKGGDASPPLPPSQVVDYERFRDSFQVTQSAPFIPTEQPKSGQDKQRRSGGVAGMREVVDEVGFGGSLRREKDEERTREIGRESKKRGLRGKPVREEVRGGEGKRFSGGGEEGKNMEEYLAALNQAMTELDTDAAAPVEPQYGGGKIKRRLSYVEHSYKQLTNNVYGDDVGGSHDDRSSLENWET